jgi:hypothetical protein
MRKERGRYTVENDLLEAAASAAAEPVSVADQRAQGVAPEDTVTIADQKAGAAPAQPQPKAARPPAPLGAK